MIKTRDDGTPVLDDALAYNAFADNAIAELDATTSGECPICMDLIQNPVLMPCKHCACKDCVLGWLTASKERGEGPVCPVCRQGPVKVFD